MHPGEKERLRCVDISNPHNPASIHQEILARLAQLPRPLEEILRRALIGERLDSEVAEPLVLFQQGRGNEIDHPETPGVAKMKLPVAADGEDDVGVELRRLSRLRKIDSPAHAEMDNEKGLLPASVLLQANQQILRPAAETRHPAAWKLSPQPACIYRIAQPGLPHIDPLDHLSLEEPLEASSYSFDFRQLRHGSQPRHIL